MKRTCYNCPCTKSGLIGTTENAWTEVCTTLVSLSKILGIATIAVIMSNAIGTGEPDNTYLFYLPIGLQLPHGSAHPAHYLAIRFLVLALHRNCHRVLVTIIDDINYDNRTIPKPYSYKTRFVYTNGIRYLYTTLRVYTGNADMRHTGFVK